MDSKAKTSSELAKACLDWSWLCVCARLTAGHRESQRFVRGGSSGLVIKVEVQFSKSG